ncbi:hypothetical protein V0R37_15190 [Pollutimonas sp. H1-120]|uniref:hypothetical protein n=1 Tax=Pollutimonas sp. H1-120 TaxID=3148824 RepID=UPI003B52846B
MTICIHSSESLQCARATYEHPGGSSIIFNADQLLMTAQDGTTAVNVEIGPLGMIKLGQALIRLGNSWQEDQQ